MEKNNRSVTDSLMANGIHCEHGIVAGYCADCDGSTPDVAKFNKAVFGHKALRDSGEISDAELDTLDMPLVDFLPTL